MTKQHLLVKYRPKCLSEVIFPTQQAEIMLKGYESGENPCPHLLFHGPNGSGKSTVANLLCESMEKRGDYVYNSPIENLLNMNDIDAIHQVSWYRCFDNDAFTIIVIEEIDQLKQMPRDKLARLMDLSSETMIVIATTNHLYKVGSKLLSRFQCFEFPKLTAAAFAPRAIHILKSEGYSTNYNSIIKMLSMFENLGDIRHYCQQLQIMVDHQPKDPANSNNALARGN